MIERPRDFGAVIMKIKVGIACAQLLYSLH